MNPIDLAMNKAKIALMSKPDTVFFSTLVFGLQHRFTTDIPTAATNGKSVLYNPDFFMKLSPEERVFLMVHEAMHVAYLHMLRGEGKDKSTFNDAADYVINLQLVERGFSMPSCGLLNRSFAGLSTEQVYELIECDQSSRPTNGIGLDLLAPEGDLEAAKNDIQDILIRAAMKSKMDGEKPGSVPKDIELYLDKLLNPKLPWTTILRKHIKQMAKNDYSFRKPNRRFFPEFYLPSLHSQKLNDLVVAVDTSGSVSTADFTQFISEIQSILRMMKPSKITLIQFDTQIKSVEEIRSVADLSKASFKGRGGTDVNELVDWINKNTAALTLVFTDGEFSTPYFETKKQMIWIIHNNPNFIAPFGKAIHYEL